MNPFDWRGPQFLLFYLCLTAIVLIIIWRRRQDREADESGIQVRFTDPYRIAHLRDGKEEALRVATISLIDRKLLRVEEKNLSRSQGKVPVTDPLEKEILQHFASSRPAEDLFKLHASSLFEEYDERLRNLGLVADAPLRSQRMTDFGIAAALLGGVAALKIDLALSRGRGNIIFLIILCALAIFLAYRFANPRHTSRAKALLADFGSLFGALKGRASQLSPNRDTQELVMLAAVFGVAAVPTTLFPERKLLYQQSTSSGDGGGGDSGSSCGSSCSGGCGSGCGGCGS